MEEVTFVINLLNRSQNSQLSMQLVEELNPQITSEPALKLYFGIYVLGLTN